MSEDYEKKAKDPIEDALMQNLIIGFDTGLKNAKRKGNWTDLAFESAVRDYFQYCVDKFIKPSKSGLALWLGADKSMYYHWSTDDKYGEIFNLVNMANQIIENQYINRSEKYPTANIFLLKASHAYIEQSKLDITTNNGESVSPNTIAEAIKQLGLDDPNYTN